MQQRPASAPAGQASSRGLTPPPSAAPLPVNHSRSASILRHEAACSQLFWPSTGPQRREVCCRAAGGQQPPSLTAPGAATSLTHPDATRRRAAALERRAARRREQEAMNKGAGWWEINSPNNMQSISSAEEFSQTMERRLAAGEAVVVDFFAPWCRACRSLYPKLTQIASRNPNVHFVKFNVEPEALKELSESMGVDRLPYFHFYKGREGLVSHFSANLNPAQLQKLRTEITNLQK